MRWNVELFNKVQSRNFIGNNAARARVTVDPFWRLRSTESVYGNSFRGPYRYYTTGDQIEYEIPNIKQVSWNRSDQQDLASCTITIANIWHNKNNEEQELTGELGKKGYFWPKRGQGSAALTWSQTAGLGAYQKDGTWDPDFSWANVLVEDALIRTYEGYPGKSIDGSFSSIDDDLNNNSSVITGTWIVNSVTANAEGNLVLNCVDIGRILLDQIVFPPVVPPAVYPLEYYPPGKSAFDSYWGPKVSGSGVSPAEKGEVWSRPHNYSGSVDSTVSTAHPNSSAVDGNWSTFAMSEAYETRDGGKPYFEFKINGSGSAHVSKAFDSLQLKTWGGGYTVYVSVYEDTNVSNPTGNYAWKGTETVDGLPYVTKFEVPLALPDNMEFPITIELPDRISEKQSTMWPGHTRYPNTYYGHTVRLTFENLYYTHIPNNSGFRYRAGIRDLIFYRTGDETSPHNPAFEQLPWTFAMEQHPVRGYWVADSDGNVYGYGDAADYDSTGFGPIPVSAYDSTNRIVGLAAHPSGEGYWAIDWMGHVFAYGASQQLGWEAVPNPYVGLNQQGKISARAIASTHTGNGYWVLYSHGVIRGFGDASPSYTVIPSTNVSIFMDSFLQSNYATGKYIPYNIGLKATSIAAHPTKMGFWVTDGSGQVFAYGACQHHGQLENRVYNKGLAGEFKLQNLEWATQIESTKTGNGYWIAFGSGRVAAFGDALKLGKDPYVFEDIHYFGDQVIEDGFDSLRAKAEYLGENILVNESAIEFDYSFFRNILWAIARDPSGDGFWVLRASGDVHPYNADFWGKPGYNGLSGLRWHDGNFDGEWSKIVSEILMWAGFLDYDPDIGADEAPAPLGLIETTGIYTDTDVPSDKFDKKTLLDVIRELTEVVGYQFRITEEGLPMYSSPNWWSAGNFDENGERIYVAYEEGELFRVSSDAPGAEPFIPVIHEAVDLLSYQVSLNSSDKRSELIVGSDLPDAKDPTRTGYVRHTPPHALETVSGGVSNMRGIERVGLYTSELFKNPEEMALMAELIGLHAWFSSRTASARIVGNPTLSIGDQVRFLERNTSETFIHLITSINSTLDNDTGSYTMDLSSYWLGSANDWVISNSVKESDYIYAIISDRLNRWQTATNRGLGPGDGASDLPVFVVDGGFVNTVNSVQSIPEMIVIGDSMSYLDSTLDGLTGDEWPALLELSGSVTDVINGSQSGATSQTLRDDPIVTPQSTNALVVFFGANDQNESLSGISTSEFYDNIVWYLDNYPAERQVVVFPWKWTGYPPGEPDPAPTLAEYNAYAAAAEAAAASRGAAFVHMGNIVSALAVVNGTTDWDEYIADWIHPSAQGHELIASSVADRLHIDYGEDNNWYFEGTIETNSELSDFKVVVGILSNLGTNISFDLYDDEDELVHSASVTNQGQVINIGDIGADDTNKTYRYVLSGNPLRRGAGKLKLSFRARGSVQPFVEGSTVFVSVDRAATSTGVTSLEPSVPELAPTLFGWSAASTSDLNARTRGVFSVPEVWSINKTDFSGDVWASNIPVHISFRPNVTGAVSTWSTSFDNYLRLGQDKVTYVTFWAEPELNLSNPSLVSITNWQKALNEVTRICRTLTSQGFGEFYSVPVFSDQILAPGSSHDITDWLNEDVDYDIIGFNIHTRSNGVQFAVESGSFASMDIVDSIDRCMDYAVAADRPWCVAGIGSSRYSASMTGVTSYSNSHRASWIEDVSAHLGALDPAPTHVSFFTLGSCNVDQDPELSAMNNLVADEVKVLETRTATNLSVATQNVDAGSDLNPSGGITVVPSDFEV